MALLLLNIFNFLLFCNKQYFHEQKFMGPALAATVPRSGRMPQVGPATAVGADPTSQAGWGNSHDPARGTWQQHL